MNLVPKRISQLGRVVTGKTPPTSRQEFFGGDYLFVTPSDLEYDHYYCRKTERTVTEEAKSALPNQFVPADAVMFTCIGATIGKCGIAPAECLTNQQINSVVANEDTDPKFLYYLLCHNLDAVKNLGGGAATPIVNKSKFEEVEFLVPSFRDQQAVSAILSAYDDVIENNRRRMALLEEAARQLYREWFVRLRFPGHEHTRITNGVPQGWETKSLGKLVEIKKGRNITKATVEEGMVPVVAGGLEPAYFHSTANAKGPVVTVSASGANAGYVNIYLEDIWASDCSYISAEWTQHVYYFYCLLKYRQQELFAFQKGAAQPHVYPKDLQRLDVTSPPNRLLQHLAEAVGPPFASIANLTAQNRQLRAARGLLLPRLMSGELAV